jgi:hypothetical protein
VLNVYDRGLRVHLLKLADTPKKQELFHLIYAGAPYGRDKTLDEFDELKCLGLPSIPDSGDSAYHIFEFLKFVMARRPTEQLFHNFIRQHAPVGLKLTDETWPRWNAVAATRCITAMKEAER